MSATGRGGKRLDMDKYYTPVELAMKAVEWLKVNVPEVRQANLDVLEPHVGSGAWAQAVRHHLSPRRVTGIDLDREARGLDWCDQSFPGCDFLGDDWTGMGLTEDEALGPDLIIGNPPWSRPEEWAWCGECGRWLSPGPKPAPDGVFTKVAFESWTEPCEKAYIGAPSVMKPTGRQRWTSKWGFVPIMESCAELHVRRALQTVRPGGVVAFVLRENFKGSFERMPLWARYPYAWDVTLVPRPSFTEGGTDSCEYGLFVWVKPMRGQICMSATQGAWLQWRKMK